MKLKEAHRRARDVGPQRYFVEGIDRGTPGDVVLVRRLKPGWSVGVSRAGVFSPTGEYSDEDAASDAFLDLLASEGHIRVDWRDVWFARPSGDWVRMLVRAEESRGNRASWIGGNFRDSRSGWRLKLELDLDALRAEFDFGEGIRLGGEGSGGFVEFDNSNETNSLRGSSRPNRTWRRARWWRKWNAAPRERTSFPDPFARPWPLNS